MYSGYGKSIQICIGMMHVSFQVSGSSWSVQEGNGLGMDSIGVERISFY